MDNHCQIQQREITPKARKAELSCSYATRRLVLFYISAKCHRNIPKGIRVTERSRNLFQIKQRVITPKVRRPELSILYVTRHHFYQVTLKYSKGYLNYRTLTPMPTPTGSVPKTICLPPPFGRGCGGGGEGGRDIMTHQYCRCFDFISNKPNIDVSVF